jgi:hypothetical protein
MEYRFFTKKQIDSAGKRVIEIHEQEYHCSESLIRTLWPVILPENELSPSIIKMVMPLRGGMASTMSSHCGGLTIGILLIGAVYGRADIEEGDAKLAPALCRQYWKMFLEDFGTSNCTLLRSGEPGPEAPTRCGCIMVRSVHLLLGLFNKIYNEKPDLDTIYSFKLDRSQEPCHERVIPIKPKEF